MSEVTSWPSGLRDTTEFPSVNVNIDASFREHLQAFCQMDGIGWNDYDQQTEFLSSSSASRARTYRKLYEKLGLVYKDQGNHIRLSQLGIQMKNLEADLNAQKEVILNSLRDTAVGILSRYQLNNPIDGADLPGTCDVLPCVCIWKAMRNLGNKIHYEEMNRVILRVLTMSDLDGAIEKIRTAREKITAYSTAIPSQLDTLLGLPVHTNQPSARIAPWFSFAGWGGLIIEINADEDGFRRLVPGSEASIDKVLSAPPQFFRTDNKEEWLSYYIGSAADVDQPEKRVEGVSKLTQYAEMDLNDRKNAFVEWMRTLIKPVGTAYGGRPYSDSVISNYANSLKYDAEKLSEFDYEEKNLFFYTDIIEFKKIQAAAKASPNFDEINKKRINKGFTCAMDRYCEFLLYLGNEENESVDEDQGEDHPTMKNCLEITLNPRINKTHPLNFIIYGAPGTGKTYSTAEYALAIIENRAVDKARKDVDQRKAVMAKYNNYIRKGQIVFTTFHQSYGYEEFIQGLRPDTNSEYMSFVTADGVFKRVADNALNHGEDNFVLIIDEINRANISKVFGELITLIESDKRWGEVNETCATLQSGDVFAVPNNLYIVGTMNSADKSISLIDAALRRRFEFIEQHPDESLIDDTVLRKVFRKLNELLADTLESSDLLIGHSYFMGKTKSDLCTILNNSIIPLLYEYFYDNKKKVISVLSDALKDTSIEIKDNKISRIYAAEKVDGQA